MSTITGIIIAKNDEELIGGALSSISFCDKKIVVDNNSTDRTQDIARQNGALILKTDSNDFSELRNLGLTKVETDYLLYIDTDERIDEDLKKSITNILINSEKYSAYKFKRKNYYYGKFEWPHIEHMERMFRKGKISNWKGKLHETPVYSGEVGELNGYLNHFTHRNLESMFNKTIEWSDKEALLRYNANHPGMSWWRFPRVMMTAFVGSYILQKGYKAGTAGLIEGIYQAFSMFITYAKLWELQKGFGKK